MKVISHSADPDGKLSAWLVANKFNLTDENDFIMTDYGKHDDIFSRISKDEKVVICDFSFENGVEDMKKLMSITKDITWIDHHASAISKYGDFGSEIPGFRVDGTAACMLTYIYYYILKEHDKVYNLSQKECEKYYNKAPLLVKLVHDYDVWRYQYGEITGSFKLGLDAEDIQSPLDPRWKDLYKNNKAVLKLAASGKVITKYRDSLGKYVCDNYGFEYEILGKKGFCLNNAMGGSLWFGDKVKEYDFVCSFHYCGDTKEWEYSFYSDASKDTECYTLAQSINPLGGGHKGAAGCTSKEFIFK